jgi:hypothetical protein
MPLVRYNAGPERSGTARAHSIGVHNRNCAREVQPRREYYHTQYKVQYTEGRSPLVRNTEAHWLGHAQVSMSVVVK